MKRNDIEITAPVGSFESLAAAIQAGANSIYFGAGNLNMRSKSSYNFSVSDLKQIQDIASESGVRTNLTVNTVVYDDDINSMETVLDAAKSAGINSVIASDMAVINYARKIILPIHCSTQLNISNFSAVEFYSQFAEVMVLARELSLDKVKSITQEIEQKQVLSPAGELVKIEVFAHGALCMAISGKCYLSLHLSDHSANRGECLQPCRRKYVATEKEQGYELEIDNEYIMSPKDLCTIGFLDKIVDAGVKVLKIEGRGRSPEYVKRVVECYKEALDAIFEGTYTVEKIKHWESRLEEVFNRGFWDGYYLGRKIGEWNDMHGSSATKKKVYVGYVQNYYPKIGVAALVMQAGSLGKNDEILIIGNKTGVVEHVISEMRIDDAIQTEAPKGTVCSMALVEKVRPNDKVYKLVAS